MDAELRSIILEGPIGRALLRLSLPIIMGNLLQAGYQLTDAFWVGRLGESAVAAVAVSFPVNFLAIALGSGIAMAGAVLVAQYAGAGKQQMVDHVAGQTMMMVLFTSILLSTVGYLVAPIVLTEMRVAEDVRTGALGFMRVSFIGFVFVFIYAMFQALMRGLGQTRLPLLIVLGTVLLNFALDPLFIFGWGPLPGTGVVGAAFATLFTQGIAATLGIFILLKGRHGIHIKWQTLKPDGFYLRRAFALGLPGSIDLSARAIGLVVMSYLVAGLGTLPTAVYGIGSMMIQIVTIPAAGLSMALTTLVGQSLGAQNRERAMKFTFFGVAFGFVSLSALGFIAFVYASQFSALLIHADSKVVLAAADFIRIMAPTWGFIGIQFAIVAAIRATGKMVHAMLISLASQWAIQFPLACILPALLFPAADGIWWSFPVTNLAAAALAFFWLVRGKFNNTSLSD